MLPSVPLPDEPAVRELCNRLCPGVVPVVLPLVRLAHARPLDCFSAVQRHRRAHGGEAVHGWQLWRWDGLFLEAEFHAVWRARDGRLRDITPKRAPVERSLFLPDPVRSFEGARIPNVRMALSDDPRVAEFIQACEEEWRLAYAGERARQRRFTLSPLEYRALAALQERKRRVAASLGLLAAAE